MIEMKDRSNTISISPGLSTRLSTADTRPDAFCFEPFGKTESGWRDLNSRPLDPQAYRTPRVVASNPCFPNQNESFGGVKSRSGTLRGAFQVPAALNFFRRWMRGGK